MECHSITESASFLRVIQKKKKGTAASIRIYVKETEYFTQLSGI